MFSTHGVETRHHQALSSLYAGFLTVDEPTSCSCSSFHAPSLPPSQDNLISYLSNFTSAKRNPGCVARPDCGGTDMGGCSMLRSLSLGSYVWASLPGAEQFEEGAAMNESMEAEPGEEEFRSGGSVGLKPSGSILLLLTKYETTLKSLGLTEPVREPAREEDTDFLFSRWGFHNGHPKGLNANRGKSTTLVKSGLQQSGDSFDNKVQKDGGGKKVSGKVLPDAFAAAKCNCIPSMPSAWRRIKSWRKDKSYRQLRGSDKDEEEIIVASPQRSYTDGTSVVVCRTLSCTNSRTSTRGRHKHSPSWEGLGDVISCDDEMLSLLIDTEKSSANKKVL